MANLRREVDRLVALLQRDHGCEARITNSSHWMITKPGCRPVLLSSTPSDTRALRNMMSDLKRNMGIQL